MKTILIILTVLLFGCKKQEQPNNIKTQTSAEAGQSSLNNKATPTRIDTLNKAILDEVNKIPIDSFAFHVLMTLKGQPFGFVNSYYAYYLNDVEIAVSYYDNAVYIDGTMIGVDNTLKHRLDSLYRSKDNLNKELLRKNILNKLKK